MSSVPLDWMISLPLQEVRCLGLELRTEAVELEDLVRSAESTTANDIGPAAGLLHGARSY